MEIFECLPGLGLVCDPEVGAMSPDPAVYWGVLVEEAEEDSRVAGEAAER